MMLFIEMSKIMSIFAAFSVSDEEMGIEMTMIMMIMTIMYISLHPTEASCVIQSLAELVGKLNMSHLNN